MSQSLAMSFRIRTLGHMVLAQPPKGLKTEIRHMGSQQCLCNGTTVKILDAKAQVSVSGWQFHAYCHISSLGAAKPVCDSSGRG